MGIMKTTGSRRRRPRPVPSKGRHRNQSEHTMAVLVVVKTPEHVERMMHWAWHVAQGRREGLTVLALSPEGPDVVVERTLCQSMGNDEPVISAVLNCFGSILGQNFKTPDMSPLILRHGLERVGLNQALAELDRIEPSLLIVNGSDARGLFDRSLAQKLYNRATCAVMVVAGEFDGPPKTLLTPTRGEVHGVAAMRVAGEMASVCGGSLTALYVASSAHDAAETMGGEVLAETVKMTGLDDHMEVKLEVILGESVSEAIAEKAKSYDAVIMGASERDPLSRTLLGTLPALLLRGREGRMMAVVRAEEPLLHRVEAFLDRVLVRWVPQMDREMRKNVYSELKTGSRWGFDFMMLIGLSTLIAGLGLIQNSAAVVIGAMLVAPLMTPILGMGLALLQSNRILLREASHAVLFGFIFAFGIGAVLGFFSPIKILSSELAARGGPNLLDLGVAFFSGIAASYALARKLNAALPGVAIAAALVPPIATAGIAFAFGEMAISAGASLLFATNVVAIILGASTCFYALGLRSLKTAEAWSRRLLSGLFIVTLVLAVPLTVYLWQVRASTPPGLNSDVQAALVEHPGFELAGLKRNGDLLTVTLDGPTDAPPELLATLKRLAIKRTNWSAEVLAITRISRRSQTTGDDWHLQMRRLIERDHSYRMISASHREGKVEVEVEGPTGPTYPFLDNLRRLAQREGLGEVRLRLRAVHEVTPQNGLRNAIGNVLKTYDGFRLRELSLQSDTLNIELEGNQPPPKVLRDRIKEVSRSRLRRQVDVKVRVLTVVDFEF